jgi:hypothetical protein
MGSWFATAAGLVPAFLGLLVGAVLSNRSAPTPQANPPA